MKKSILTLTTTIIISIYASTTKTSASTAYISPIATILSQHNCITTTAINNHSYLCKTTEETIMITIEGVLTNDFDNNGTTEHFIIWGENHGGSGTFKYQAIISGTATINSQYLEDRTKIESIYLKDNLIYTNTISHKPEDPLCCPTNKQTKSYQWKKQKLTLIEIIVR